jgi:hypothetical protein
MTDRATPNLPAIDMAATCAFWRGLGFQDRYLSDGWSRLSRGALEIEFFSMPELDPKQSGFSACLRVDNLDDLRAAFAAAGIPDACGGRPRMDQVQTKEGGFRIFHLVDINGSLIRCIDNRTAAP